jgi:hypothetical protein
MTKPSSRVVIGVPGSRRFRVELWSAESSGDSGDAVDCGCIVIVRLTATACRGEGEAATGARRRRRK